jgi:uncharacterized protein (DUF488 family)
VTPETVFTIGHGTRPVEELVECLLGASVGTLVDIRRFPTSRRNPQFDRDRVAASLGAAGIAYRHVEELGGRRSGEEGEGRFACIREAAFRSYLARMGRPSWQEALAAVLTEQAPCLMCAETVWWRCHRRLVADLLVARGVNVVHLFRAHDARPHRLGEEAEARHGRLYVCGELVT